MSSSSAPQRFDPPGFAFAGMSQAIRCDDVVMISGQVALKNGVVVGVGDAQAQAEQCFVNLRNALAEAGADLSDVINLRCYLTRRDAFAGYSAVKNKLFPAAPPCSTTVIVADLLLPGLLMEIEATAWRPIQSSG